MAVATRNPSTIERLVVHNALLAQVDDVHVGGVYQWGEPEFEASLRVLSDLTGSECTVDRGPERAGDDAETQAIVQSLLVPVYDLDHPDLSDEQWDAAERLLAELSAEFGR
jgi:hypothetical protein